MMRKRVKRLPGTYPNWLRKKEVSPAKLAKQRDNNKCVDCGIEDRTIATNADGEVCIVYLHAAHVHYLDPDRANIAPIQGEYLRARCPSHHATYDNYWRRREEAFLSRQRQLRTAHMHQRLRQFPMLRRFLEVQ